MPLTDNNFLCLLSVPFCEKQAEKVFSLWDSEPDINPKDGADINWPVAGHIELRNVGFHYQMRPDNKVLKGFNLDIPAGKTVALGKKMVAKNY